MERQACCEIRRDSSENRVLANDVIMGSAAMLGVRLADEILRPLGDSECWSGDLWARDLWSRDGGMPPMAAGLFAADCLP